MRRAASGIAVAALLVTLTGCTSGSAVTQVAVGDCMGPLLGDGAQIERITPVPCSEPHAWEAYASTTIEGVSKLPSPEDLQRRIESLCIPAFEEFVGLPLQQSEYMVQPLTPTENTWRSGDRTIMCLVGTAAGGVTGSLKGSKK